ncbi:MAG: HAMP domain-containing histidine kinase [Proteobacteria bacterium]|nr:HAMP domain-containing histidine kinase [Pseudomonadota bacterium]
MARIQYRRRLRSRIIISFVLFGFALTALFALSAIYLRGYLEDKLIGEALIKNVDDYATKFHEDPSNEFLPFQKIVGWVYSERKFANVPLAWRDLDDGVHDLTEPDGRGGRLVYKLAVRKEPGYWFFLKYDTTQERHSQRLLEGALFLSVLGFLAVSLVLGYWLSRRVMSPVTDLARRVQAMGRSGKAEALAPHFANDEVGQLAAALDDYSGKLTALVERDREFNADVSHELRTPLAVIATTTELLLNAEHLTDKVRERLKRIERASRQSTELTNALLLLSRSERSAPTDGETTDVAQVVEQVIDVYRSQIGRKPIEVKLVVEQPVEVVAPSSVVAVALGNLVGNAFKYTPKGDVVITVGAARGVVTIEDSGPGIKPEDAEKLFERGVRGESATGTSGAGLGLAIVIRLCQLYDWRVSLAPRPQGGAVATLDFRLRG